MIKELLIENFRGFSRHVLPLRPTTVIVGRNNAGKSTVAEAFRLVSLVANRYEYLTFQRTPAWLSLPARTRGVSPSLKDIIINFDGLFHHYGDPPAVVKATFDKEETITIYLGKDGKIFAFIKNSHGKTLSSKAQARLLNIPRVSIQPQLGPLAAEEEILTPGYVRSSISSYLASMHFRNQLNLLYHLFEQFKENAESSWPGLQVLSLEGKGGMPGHGKLALLVRDRDFAAEIAWMGHGLQMWLQTIWFLTRAQADETVILDEPDVYMHADLQRKLIRFLKERHRQVIIATHSTEILAEVDPDEVLVIDRRRTKSSFANSLPGVQEVIEHCGSVHNIQLTRLWSARRLLLIEGDDLSLLKIVHDKLFPNAQEPLDTVPNMAIGGWGGWNYVVGSSLLLKNSGGQEIAIYCILDSDYHTADEIEERRREARERRVQLHIWSQKEIENYFLVPSGIQRIIASISRREKSPPSTKEVTEQIDRVCERLRNDVFDAVANEILVRNRGEGLSNANKRARVLVDSNWSSREGRFSVIPGKKAISLLSQWAQQEYGVSLSCTRIAHELRSGEIAGEIRNVVTAIERTIPLGNC
jgi:hypothetical protein